MRFERRFFIRAAVCVMTAGLSIAAVSCGGGKSGVSFSETATRDYNANLAKWRASAPQKYKLQAGASNVFVSERVSTTVVDGQITEQSVDSERGSPVPEERAAGLVNQLGTVDRLFANAKSTIDSLPSNYKSTDTLITYDAQYGFPKIIRSPSMPGVQDAVGGASVIKFEIIP